MTVGAKLSSNAIQANMEVTPLFGEGHLSKTNKRLFGIYTVWMVGGFFLMILAGTISEWILVGVFLLMIAVVVMSYRVRCHSCRWPLIKRWWGYAPYAPRACPKCGEKVM